MEPLMGSILLFGATFAPSGYMLCDGRLLSIAQYSALFSLLGTQYGGDGVQTFALPNLPPFQVRTGGQVLVCIAVEGIFPSRAG